MVQRSGLHTFQLLGLVGKLRSCKSWSTAKTKRGCLERAVQNILSKNRYTRCLLRQVRWVCLGHTEHIMLALHVRTHVYLQRQCWGTAELPSPLLQALLGCLPLTQSDFMKPQLTGRATTRYKPFPVATANCSYYGP